MKQVLLIVTMLASTTALASAGGKHWQTGTWTDVGVKRQIVDFGPGATSFDPRGRGMSMRAMADVRTFVIETDDLHIELQDVVPVNRRSVEATVGQPVRFAIDKNTVYVKDGDGAEHKLRVTKKTAKDK